MFIWKKRGTQVDLQGAFKTGSLSLVGKSGFVKVGVNKQRNAEPPKSGSEPEDRPHRKDWIKIFSLLGVEAFPLLQLVR